MWPPVGQTNRVQGLCKVVKKPQKDWSIFKVGCAMRSGSHCGMDEVKEGRGASEGLASCQMMARRAWNRWWDGEGAQNLLRTEFVSFASPPPPGS